MDGDRNFSDALSNSHCMAVEHLRGWKGVGHMSDAQAMQLQNDTLRDENQKLRNEVQAWRLKAEMTHDPDENAALHAQLAKLQREVDEALSLAEVSPLKELAASHHERHDGPICDDCGIMCEMYALDGKPSAPATRKDGGK